MEKINRLRLTYKVLIILSIMVSIIVSCLGIVVIFINMNYIFLISSTLAVLCLFGIAGLVKKDEEKEVCNVVIENISNELTQNAINSFKIQCSIIEERNAILASVILNADVTNHIYLDCYNIANETLEKILGYKNKYIALNFTLSRKFNT